jgi:hypothetical protein
MKNAYPLDRRKHHGPFRFMFMPLSAFLARFLGRA